MGHNLKFLNKAYLELTKGYIRIPSSLLKIVSEQLLFSRKTPKIKLLEKVGQDGVLFKIKDKPNFWKDVLEKEMLSQMKWYNRNL